MKVHIKDNGCDVRDDLPKCITSRMRPVNEQVKTKKANILGKKMIPFNVLKGRSL